MDTYTEVTLDSNGKSVRPDGVIRVTYGKRSFTALVEVKTGDSMLDKDQINQYWQSARQAGYDHVITISNEIAPSGAHPVHGLRVQKNSPVQISHLSWVRILATALRLKNHTGVDDPEQAWILEELVRYLQHDASGVLPDGTPFQGPGELRKALLTKREGFVTTVTEKLLTYALGRGLEYYDAPAVRKITREAAPSEYRWASLILGIVRSTPFQKRRSLDP